MCKVHVVCVEFSLDLTSEFIEKRFIHQEKFLSGIHFYPAEVLVLRCPPPRSRVRKISVEAVLLGVSENINIDWLNHCVRITLVGFSFVGRTGVTAPEWVMRLSIRSPAQYTEMLQKLGSREMMLQVKHLPVNWCIILSNWIHFPFYVFAEKNILLQKMNILQSFFFRINWTTTLNSLP